MLQCSADGGFFFRRTLRDDGVRVLRVIVTLPDGEAAFALDLRDIEACDLEAVMGFHIGLQLLVGRRGLRCSQREVLVGQLHQDLIVRPVLAQKNDA